MIDLQEEENARLTTAKRRLQREIDELTEQNETLQRDLTAAKKRLVDALGRTLVLFWRTFVLYNNTCSQYICIIKLVTLFVFSPCSSSSGRRATGLSGLRSGGRAGRRQHGTTAAGHSGQSANSGESLGDDDDDM